MLDYENKSIWIDRTKMAPKISLSYLVTWNQSLKITPKTRAVGLYRKNNFLKSSLKIFALFMKKESMNRTLIFQEQVFNLLLVKTQ